MSFGSPTIDGNGTYHYPVTSSLQASSPLDCQVILPSSFTAGKQRRFLYILPVVAGTTGGAYGNPEVMARGLDIANNYEMIVVIPEFAIDPWYADHPSTSTVKQESYMTTEIVPNVEALHDGGFTPRRLLVGFSKSGLGAWQLLVRSPSTFDAAACWDAPMDTALFNVMTGSGAVYGTQGNYDDYVPRGPNMASYAANFQSSPSRLWFHGYANFRTQMSTCHTDYFDANGFVHTWADGPSRSHDWNSGWVPDALAFLDTAAPALDIDPPVYGQHISPTQEIRISIQIPDIAADTLAVYYALMGQTGPGSESPILSTIGGSLADGLIDASASSYTVTSAGGYVTYAFVLQPYGGAWDATGWLDSFQIRAVMTRGAETTTRTWAFTVASDVALGHRNRHFGSR